MKIQRNFVIKSIGMLRVDTPSIRLLNQNSMQPSISLSCRLREVRKEETIDDGDGDGDGDDL
jgi:hypothetical protein